VRLSDARKVLALPSVTNVLGVIAKPALDAWKVEQGIMAALTLPRLPDETLDAFARRVVTDMGQQVAKAADFGSRIHAACEVYALTKELPSDPALLQFIDGWRGWFDENVERIHSIETVFVNHEHGYAGRVDIAGNDLRGGDGDVLSFAPDSGARLRRWRDPPARNGIAEEPVHLAQRAMPSQCLLVRQWDSLGSRRYVLECYGSMNPNARRGRPF